MTRNPIRLIPLLAAASTVSAVLAVTGCSTAPAGPQITPVNATIKLGRVTEKTFLTRIDVPNNANYGGSGGYGGGYGVGVGAAGASGGGGSVGVGFSVDLTHLLNRQPPQPPQQMDLYQYKVQAMDGTVAQVNAPAAPGLEPGTCVRLIYPDGSAQPQMAPSNEC
ncbi:hypothetical protein [Cupriavidus sp. BIS7]|uniref:hypothetical protein n=1 Tax=Cupriavidus sp. BIS7 TaxID=1217718 RepID=UPI0002D84FDD|nr:hypothetical protein [Cupriavidus sp. BIS7]